MSWKDVLRPGLSRLGILKWYRIAKSIPVRVHIAYYRKFLLPGIIREKSKKEQLTVVFLATNVPMWKHDGLFRLMQKHPRFRPIVISAMRPNESEGEWRIDQEQMKEFFSSCGFEFIRGFDFEVRKWVPLKSLNPDILFYTQPYTEIVVPEYYFYKHLNSLQCYVPYAFETIAEDWTYNCPYQNSAWKIFLPTGLHKTDARKRSGIKAVNSCVAGYPTADEYAAGGRKSEVWKKTFLQCKKVIWAPHHSIFSGTAYGVSSFLQYCDAMLGVAKKYSDKIVFAFKPHPALLTSLYLLWGKEKTDSYYAEWENMGNAFVQTGAYKDLFLQSDALIHDCGSFTVEYLYTQNPTMFLYREDRTAKESEFGRLALDVHYAGHSIQDIERFIEDVVLGGNDPKKELRKRFYNKYLLPPNGQSVAQNILDEIERGLGWK